LATHKNNNTRSLSEDPGDSHEQGACAHEPKFRTHVTGGCARDGRVYLLCRNAHWGVGRVREEAVLSARALLGAHPIKA
jgi:hypothetical protein